MKPKSLKQSSPFLFLELEVSFPWENPVLYREFVNALASQKGRFTRSLTGPIIATNCPASQLEISWFQGLDQCMPLAIFFGNPLLILKWHLLTSYCCDRVQFLEPTMDKSPPASDIEQSKTIGPP